MMVIGVDPHKQTHTAVAADELGRKKAHKTVRARRDGHRELIAWARELAPAGRLWAVGDVRHVAGGLIRELLAAGEQVVFVPPKLMAGERRGGRERGKSDPIDALAIARLALREGAGLPAARLDEQVLEVRRLTDYRDDLVAERTRVVNRLRWMVHDLDPELAPAPRSLGSARARTRLEAGLAALPASAGQRIALSQLARITALSAEITGLEKALAALVAVLVPGLLATPGVAVIVERHSGCRRGRRIPALCAPMMSAACPRGVCAGWRRRRADGGVRRPSRCLLAECSREGRVALGGASAHGRGERG
jgi:transposase